MKECGRGHPGSKHHKEGRSKKQHERHEKLEEKKKK